MASKTQYYDLFRRLVDTEKEYADRLKESARKAENLGVRVLIEAVAMDSLKHSMIYKSIVEGLDNVEYLTKPESAVITSEIDYHITTEADFIRKLQEIIPNCSDETIKFLLKIILEDEIRHHAMLRTIKELIVKKQKQLDENLWKFLEGELERSRIRG